MIQDMHVLLFTPKSAARNAIINARKETTSPRKPEKKNTRTSWNNKIVINRGLRLILFSSFISFFDKNKQVRKASGIIIRDIPIIRMTSF